MAERLVELTLKKGTFPNRFIRSLFRAYRGEDPPQLMDACKTFWSVLILGSILQFLLLIGVAMEFLGNVLLSFLHLVGRYVSVAGRPMGEAAEKRVAPAIGSGTQVGWKKGRLILSVVWKIIWLLFWPIRKLFSGLLAVAGPVMEWLGDFAREHEKGCWQVIIAAVSLYVLGMAGLALYKILMESWFWTVIAFVLLLAGIGLTAIIYTLYRVGFLGFVWDLLMAAKRKFCPLIRVE